MKKIILSAIIVIFLVIIFAVLGFVGTYNSLQVADETINSNWAQVENQLKRRNVMIQNLVSTGKGYAAHEKEVVTNIAEARSELSGARSSNDVKAVSQSSCEVNSALSRLLFVVERYPGLKADKSFLALQDELAGTENRLAVARKDYNDSVKALNARIRTFPTSIIASISGIKAREYFEIDEGEKATPKVEF